MIKSIKNALPDDLITEALHLYCNSINQVELNGVITERYVSGKLGIFLLSLYTEQEFNNIWSHLKPLIEDSVECKVEPYEFRILRYGTDGFVNSHYDKYSTDPDLNSKMLSIIIMLSPGQAGGEFIIDGEICKLDPGDLMLWTSEHPHQVRTVKRGTRYSINIRCLMVK